MSTLDVIYLVRPGNRNDELRYSLRSLANLPHGRVWIAGHKPTWLTDVEHIPAHQARVSRENVSTVLLAACQADGPTDNVILMHDDYYVMRPIINVPTLHNGPLAHMLNTRYTSGYYHRATIRTLALLASHGIRHPLSYDGLHTPMVTHRPTMAAHLTWAGPGPLQYRSLYGNLTHAGGKPGADAKAPADATDATFLSTASMRGDLAEYIAARLPNPSHHEADQGAALPARLLATR